MKSVNSRSDQVPRFLTGFIKWLIAPHLREEILGDLQERYERRARMHGAPKARIRCWLEILAYMRPAFIKRQKNKYPSLPFYSHDMIRNYFKIAWRNIVRQKAYSLLNIAGLSIGMACSILILLWVQNELSYDRFHTRAGRLFRLTCNAGDFKTAVSAAGMARGLQSQLPQIIAGVRISKPNPLLLEVGEKKVEEKRVFYADSNFLEVFSFPLLAGNPATALKDPGAILITEKMAEKYYGTRDALGKTIRINNNENFTIAGVLANAPSNSHLQFDVIIPMKTMAKWNWDLQTDTWGNFNFYTYLELDDKTAASASARQKLTKQISQIFKDRGQTIKLDFQLQPLTDIHLHSNLQIDLPGHGNIQYVNVFFVVAIFILIVACINFMNLATARSERRAKEVGLRKVVGANRYQLVFQFMGESLMFSFLSLIIAIGIVYLLLPVFKMLTEKTLTIHLLDGKLLLSLAGIAILTGLVSGSYPALFLSGFAPVKVLKGKLRVAGGNLFFRNALVVTQFVVAIVLLVGTAVVYKQLDFIKKRNLGFDKSNLLYLPMTGELGAKQQALKASLAQNPLTENFTVISDLPTKLETGTTDVTWDGQPTPSQVVFRPWMWMKISLRSSSPRCWQAGLSISHFRAIVPIM